MTTRAPMVEINTIEQALKWGDDWEAAYYELRRELRRELHEEIKEHHDHFVQYHEAVNCCLLWCMDMHRQRPSMQGKTDDEIFVAALDTAREILGWKGKYAPRNTTDAPSNPPVHRHGDDGGAQVQAEPARESVVDPHRGSGEDRW